ncbi:hypothetical protein CEK28_06460 [Xenophilus sp. AP218F]|nr:hypothetical protein CEK28_06460 [Xenophilus sp. AP218F]
MPEIPARLTQMFDLRLHSQPYAFARRYLFLGGIPRNRYREGRRAMGVLRQADGSVAPDLVADDSTLVCRTDSGLTIFSGCAHSGIRHVADYAMEACGDSRVRAVIGGFHLRSASPLQVWRARRYFQSQSAPALYACHGSGYARRFLPRQHAIAVGSQLRFD